MNDLKDRVLEMKRVAPKEVLANARNWRTHPPEQRAAMESILAKIGVADVLLAYYSQRNDGALTYVDGHLRQEIAPEVPWPTLVLDLTDAEADLLLANLDPLGSLAGMDAGLLKALQADNAVAFPLPEGDGLLAVLLAQEAELDALLKEGRRATPDQIGSLVQRFIVPPFSVLDARQGYWQKRKRAWLALGIRSDLGRTDLATTVVATDWMKRGTDAGGSVFDPVLCELAYRWFCPPGGQVLDPFAGGSVRGVVGAALGRRYLGIELRVDQVQANREQAKAILQGNRVRTKVADPMALTPVEAHGSVLVKRDDLFSLGGVSGGKVRTCWHLMQGAIGVTTAGSRQSPQVNIVAQLAKLTGIPARVHTPTGELSPEVLAAQEAGAELVQHKAGYNSVIIARSKADAKAQGWRDIPFGMECAEAVAMTRRQVANLPFGQFSRLVMPVGSGMSLAGVLWGLVDAGQEVPVLGVVVGAAPVDRLEKYAPPGWQGACTLVASGLDYHAEVPEVHLGALALDPVYEAKCLPHLQPGDLLWVVGIRATAEAQEGAANSLLEALAFEAGNAPAPVWVAGDSAQMGALLSEDAEADLVFTCPPYADLEVYSDAPADLSTLKYPAFRAAYASILANAVRRLKEDRFAVLVVGDVRDGAGLYRNFVAHTVEAMEAAGCRLYNDAVYITPAGSLPIRAGRIFEGSRKLVKGHQNVLVFVKGDPARAHAACGPLVVAEVEGEGEGQGGCA